MVRLGFLYFVSVPCYTPAIFSAVLAGYGVRYGEVGTVRSGGTATACRLIVERSKFFVKERSCLNDLRVLPRRQRIPHIGNVGIRFSFC